MRLAVLGAGGIVGQAVSAEARRRGWELVAWPRATVDVTVAAQVRAALEDARPGLVVNCAGFTGVDRSESESAAAFAVNDGAVGVVAAECERVGARLIHLSSDYVFAGERNESLREEAAPAPLSVYGRSKLAGEQRLRDPAKSLILRTSSVFGVGGKNFVDSIAARIRRGNRRLEVVADQISAPTYAPFLARALADLGESGATGIVHYRNREPVSWFDFARAIAGLLDPSVEVRPTTARELGLPAPRPAYSVLSVERFESRFGRRVEPWMEGLREHLARAPKEME